MPDFFNLERLKKEAKALLKQCRAGEAATMDRLRAHLPSLSTLESNQFVKQIKLSDIHQALAHEHGYPNWAELKGHDAPVERFLAEVRSGVFNASRLDLRRFPELVRESIHAACAIGDVDAVRYHLDREPTLIEEEAGGWRPLIYACASRFHLLSPRYAAGILDCVSLLLDRGADPNGRPLGDSSDSDSAVSALLQAQSARNPQVEALLLKRGAQFGPKPRSKAGRLLVPQVPMDDVLTKAGRADPKFNEEIRRRLAPVKDRFFAKPAPGDWDGSKEPPTLPFYLTEPDLREVAIGLVEFAIEHGVNVNLAIDHEGNTLLHEFSRLKDYPKIAAEAVEWLLTHGADPNLARNDGLTAFVLAARSGCVVAENAMRSHGADVSSAKPADRLIGACRSHDERTALEILQRHPKLLVTSVAAHELFVSAAADRQAAVRFMAQLGFDPGLAGESGATALHVAAWNGHLDMVRLLLDLGAPVNVRDATFGASPLAWAAQASGISQDRADTHCAIVEALLDAGADYATCVNRWGVGPEERSSVGVARLLRARGFVG